MFGIDKNTWENILILIAGVFLFNGVIRIPVVGQYFDKAPYLAIITAVLILVFKDKIAGMIGG